MKKTPRHAWRCIGTLGMPGENEQGWSLVASRKRVTHLLTYPE
jgi:hypothetical protein